MLSKLPAVLIALLLTASLLIVATDSAEARRGRNAAFGAGVALGVLGLSALSARANDREHCYRGEPRCHWVRGDCYRNCWGDVECEPGYNKCYRPVHCD